ncbi:MAG: hypothetical protein HYZ37_06420 [Candidatus Solibacter usitatus]|nr:hypothetical protein [Candidatus Solibacter usitatus]
MENFGNTYTVARRTLDLEDYVDIMRRQKAWIIGPTFAALVIAVVVAYLWPDTYISSAVVRVTPPQVPEQFVATNVNMEMTQRINSMAQQILSRSTLTNIINTFGLYQRERTRLPMEDVVENMRKSDVRISNVVNFSAGEGKRQVPAFQISFAYEKRDLAQKVCSDLVSRFVNENARDRTNQSQFTTQFLRDQLDGQRKQLEEVEDKLAQFRIKNAGRLPDQVQQNITQLSALEQRSANVNGSQGRLQQEKLMLESTLRILKEQFATLGSGKEEVTERREIAKNEAIARMDNQILVVETQLAALRENYKEQHPEVQSHVAALSVLKRQKDLMEKEEATKKPDAPQKKMVTNPAAVREAREYDGSIKRLESALEAKEIEIKEAKVEATRVDSQIRAAQKRIESTPLGEKEYMDLLRERDLVRQQVEELNKKQSNSRIATELETRQQGENLELLDPASLPQKPAQPDRVMIIGAGVAIGIAFGLFLSLGRELKDGSLKNLKDVRAYTQLSILGCVPLLENDLVVRRRRRLAWLAWSTASIVGVLVMSGSVYYYYFVTRV